MFINTIIWVKNLRNLGNSYVANKSPDQSDFILHYSSGISNRIYTPYPKEKFDQEDKWGKYYKTSGGHQKNTYLRKGADYFPEWRVNKHPFFIKYYEWESKGDRIGNTWIDLPNKINTEAIIYPTQKRFRLLKRIICLSTV